MLRKKRLIQVVGVCFAAILARTVFGTTSVQFQWNPNIETNILLYRVYYGTDSRTYTSALDVLGTETAATVPDLVEGGTYYFALTAINSDGLESPFSSEIAYTAPLASLNLPPTLGPLASVTLSEDSAPLTIPLSGISSGSPLEAQVLQVSARCSVPGLVTAVVDYTSPAFTGILTIAPSQNAFGSGVITVDVSDGLATTSQSFNVSVTPVNDPPSLDALADVVLPQNASAKTVTLTGISSGAPNEVQTLRVTATSSNTALIGSPLLHYASPNISAALSYLPISNAWGTSTITVKVNDGQPSNNIAMRSFVVTVNNPPTLDPLGDITMSEDGPAQTISLSGITSGAANEAQPLQVTVSSSNPNLITPTFTYSSPNTSGVLTIKPAPGAYGTAVITVTVNDGQRANNVASRSFLVTVNGVNQPPTLAPFAPVVLTENAGALTISATGISSGSPNEAQPLSVTADSSNPALIPAPAVRYASPGTTANISFKPATNAWGNSIITVTVNDGQPSNNIVTRSFNVLVNNPPTLDPMADIAINQDAPVQTVTLTGIGSGAAAENQLLQVSASSSAPALLSPTVTYSSPNRSGLLSFKPASGTSGSAVVTVTVNDGQSGNNLISRSFTVTVYPVNQPPTLDALGDVVLVDNASAITIPLTGITSGSSAEAQMLSVSAKSSNPGVVAAPSVSYASPNTSGSLTVKPATNAWGSATITVAVNDGQPSNNVISRTFSVIVNNPPTLDALSNLAIYQDAPTQTLNLTGISSGSSFETQELQVSASSSVPSLISPLVSYTSPSSTGLLTFKPAAGASGVAVITVMVSDGQAANSSVSRSFTINVNPLNQPPTLDPLPASIAMIENASALIPLTGISSGSTTEIQALTVTTTSSNPALVPAPTVSYASPNASGSILLRPMSNAWGSATISVTVNDGQPSNNVVSRSFPVVINNPPTLDPLGNVAFTQDAPSQSLALTGISSGSASENQVLQVTAACSNPALIAPTVSYTSPNSSGILTLKPAAGASGSAVVTVTVNDGQSGNNVLTQSFSVSVTPLNQPPTLNPLFASLVLPENAATTNIALSGISSGSSAENQTLTVTATSSNPALIPPPIVSYTSPNTAGTISIKPASNAWGTAVITVSVNDGQPSNNVVSRSFSVLVNNAPSLDPIANLLLSQDAPTQSINLSGISSGAAVEAQSLQITATSSAPSLISPTVSYTSPNSTGALNFKPTAGASGSAIITVTVNDGQSGNNVLSRAFTVTVNPVNQPPTLAALPSSVVLLENAAALTIPLSGISSGATNEAQTLSVTATSSNPSVLPSPGVTYVSPNTSGSLSLKPISNTWGTATISVTVNDGQPSNNVLTRSFSVLVNNPPTLDPVSNLTIYQEGPVQTIALSGISSGAAAEAQPLQITATSSAPALINPTVTYSSPGTTGTLTFKPAPGASGAAVITVTVNDGQSGNNTFSRSFTVTVNPVNQPPTLDPLPTLVAVAENSGSVTIPLTGMTSGAVGELQSLTVTATSSNPALLPAPAVSYVSPNSSGTLTLKCASNAWGTATVTVTVDDGQPSNNVVSRSFNVLVNNSPSLDPIANIALMQNTSATVTLTGISSGSTNEAQPLSISTVSSNPALLPAPALRYASPGTTANISFKPAANAWGNATITVTVNDGQLSNNVVMRSFSVLVNNPPTLEPIASVSITGPSSLSLTGIGSGATNEMQVLTVKAVSSNPAVLPNPTVTYGSPSSSATLSFVPTAGASGSATVTVTVSDGQSANSSATRSFTVTVNAQTVSVASVDAAPLEATTLTSPDSSSSTPPTVSSFELSGRDAGRLAFSWNTAAPATCFIDYGTSTNLDHQSEITTLATNHFLILTNLSPGTDYFMRVHAQGSDEQVAETEIGRSSTANVTLLTWSAEGGSLNAPVAITRDDAAERGEFISSAVENAGSARYYLDIPDDSVYRLWFRTKSGPNGGSLRISVDNGVAVLVEFPATVEEAWHWQPFLASGNLHELTFGSGIHQLSIESVNANTFLDELALSNDPNWIPGNGE